MCMRNVKDTARYIFSLTIQIPSNRNIMLMSHDSSMDLLSTSKISFCPEYCFEGISI